MSLVSHLFGGEILDPFLSLINKCPVLNTPTDWKETPEAHVFVADLPGLNKDEVKVEVEHDQNGNYNILQISGEREDPDVDNNNNNNEKWHRVERCRGKFSRRFRLLEDAKAEEVKASMENGVLTVTIPKQEVKKTEKKVVQIEGD